MPKKSHFTIFAMQNFVQNTNVFFFFSFFYLELFTLDSPAVTLTHEFHLDCWDHVCKINECLVVCFYRKFRVFRLRRAFNDSSSHFSRFEIFTLILTLELALK